jgi:hypothetical protein
MYKGQLQTTTWKNDRKNGSVNMLQYLHINLSTTRHKNHFFALKSILVFAAPLSLTNFKQNENVANVSDARSILHLFKPKVLSFAVNWKVLVIHSILLWFQELQFT